MVSQQWLARTTAPGVAPDDRRRLDLVIYGASRRGEALCCDVTLVSPLRADGRPQPASSERDGAAIDVANGATLNWPAWARNASSSWRGGRRVMGAKGARPRPQPHATAFPTRAAGAASCCSCGVGAPVVGAAGLRVAARLGLDAVGRLLACALWSSPRRSNPPRGYPWMRITSPTLGPQMLLEKVRAKKMKQANLCCGYLNEHAGKMQCLERMVAHTVCKGVPAGTQNCVTRAKLVQRLVNYRQVVGACLDRMLTLVTKKSSLGCLACSEGRRKTTGHGHKGLCRRKAKVRFTAIGTSVRSSRVV